MVMRVSSLRRDHPLHGAGGADDDTRMTIDQRLVCVDTRTMTPQPLPEPVRTAMERYLGIETA